MKLSPHPANFSAPKCRLATLAVILGQKNGGFALYFSQLSAKISVTSILRHPLFGDCFFLRQYDENGEPLVVYHGTSRGDFKVFSTSNQWGYGAAYFANNRAVADVFAVPSMGQGDSTVDTQQVAAFARDNGYDGVIVRVKSTLILVSVKRCTSVIIETKMTM